MGNLTFNDMKKTLKQGDRKTGRKIEDFFAKIRGQKQGIRGHFGYLLDFCVKRICKGEIA